MELAKKSRTPFRASFTRTLNEIKAELLKEVSDLGTLKIKMKLSETTYEKIQASDNQIKELLLDEDADEADLQTEQESVDKYLDEWLSVSIPVNELLTVKVNSPPTSVCNSTACSDKQRSFKLPKIELKKFNGQLTDWLGWWAQFKKIHEREDLDATDKFQYLLQSMAPKTRARKLVEGYPQTDENYPKVIQALQDRFGRKNLLIQVYVRELFKMGLQNLKTAQGGKSIVQMYDRLESHIRALESLGVTLEQAALFLFPMVESSQPEDILIAWQRSPWYGRDGSKEIPPKGELDYLLQFLRQEVESEEQRELAKPGFGNIDKEKNVQNAVKKSSNSEESVSTAAGLFHGQVSTCIFCDKQHESKECGRGEFISLEEKRNKVREKNACYNCLKPGHNGKSCKAFVKCHVCSKKHLTIMCPDIHKKSDTDVSENMKQLKITEGKQKVSDTTATGANLDCSGEILLKTVIAYVSFGRSGELVPVCVLFDDGSQRSYITSSIIRKIKSQPIGQELSRNVLFDGSVTGFETVNKHQLVISSLNGENNFALILREKKTIGGKIPKVPAGPWIQELKKKGILVNDQKMEYSSLIDIDVVVGSVHWGLLMTGRMEKLHSGLTATESVFGWTVSGPVPKSVPRGVSDVVTMFLAEEHLSKLWNLDVIGITDPIDKKTKLQEETEAKNIFKKNVSRDVDGRYSVKLPWANGEQDIPTNKACAEQRLMSTTKKLNIKGQFKTYDTIIRSWIQGGFIEECPMDEPKCHYLPHHPVFKDSFTTPVRPVFDASCKIGQNPSLNDCLFKGPNLIELIPSVLMRFRENKIGVLSDIRKAFQMIDLKEEDRDYLRFLWWEDSEQKKIVKFRHKRVVFGLNCSPFLLGAVLELHLNNVQPQLKELADKLLKGLNVDNCVTSVNSFEEYEEFRNVTTRIMSEAKMDLRQWECTLGEESRIGLLSSGECGLETGKLSIPQNTELVHTKCLGMIWDRKSDTLSIDIKPQEYSNPLTKRNVASVLHKVFDPIGVTCPALLQPKILLQRAWEQDFHWDKELPHDWDEQFKKWCSESYRLTEIQIPRMCKLPGKLKLQIHTFCDASQDAYAAVVFIRSESDNEVMVQLLQAKCRVSPIGKPTIPRLELLGCLIGSRLTTSVREAMALERVETYYWSDSTTAISWIQRNDDWGTFVGNQVKKILKLCKSSEWRHVPGSMNPADLPSRGCSPQQLVDSKWWEGPEWLYKPEREWPVSTEEVDEEEVAQEKKKTSTTMKVTTEISWYVPKFSSYLKNVKVFAWLRRFFQNARKQKEDRIFTNHLQIPEVRVAELDVIRIIQSSWTNNNSKLPLIKKEDGIIYLKSAILNRTDKKTFKWPMVLPHSHPLVEQLIREAHISHCHGGAQQLMGKLREKYWIIQARKKITNVVHKCVICRRFNQKKLDVEPTALPEYRTRSGEVFDTTGVDLAGPLQLKGEIKAWIVLFTCAVYRAVHLDIVTSLSSEAFLASLERFIHQFGRPHTMCSDNRTNFVGANNLLKSIDFKRLESEFALKRIQWTFNPPTASWWGGWWERLIQTVKGLLRRMIGKSRLTYDELRTCLSAVASTINDRPLATVTEDPNDLTPLTPMMFLRGTKNTTFPEGGIITSGGLQGQYKKVQSLQEAIQNRFRKEYLAQLVQRASGKSSHQIKEGDIVLVGADNKKRFEWPLGRVVETMPGKDGEVRAVKVRTKQGYLVRPVQRLYPLEINSSDEKPPNPKHDSQCQVKEQFSVDLHKQTRSGRIIKKPSRYGQWNC